MTEENSQLKNARPPVKVQNERRMASFFVWMAWWCRAVLMHRTRWFFLESLPQPLPKGKGFGAALTGIFFGESKKQRGKETKRRRVKETERRGVKETERRGVKESKRRRDEESAQRLFDGFEQGLNRVCSMVVQWLFNGRSMVVQWLFNGRSMVVQWLVLFFLEGVAKNPDALCGGATGVGFTLV